MGPSISAESMVTANSGPGARFGRFLFRFRFLARWLQYPQNLGGPGSVQFGYGLGMEHQEWPRQTKPKEGQFMNFSQGHSGTKVRDVNRACFPKEKRQNSHKRATFMNFSFWPFLWFGLLGRLLRTVRAVPVFGSGGSSKEGLLCVSVQFKQRGRFRFRFWFPENGSGGSSSAFASWENGSDGFPVSGSGSVPGPPCKTQCSGDVHQLATTTLVKRFAISFPPNCLMFLQQYT